MDELMDEASCVAQTNQNNSLYSNEEVLIASYHKQFSGSLKYRFQNIPYSDVHSDCKCSTIRESSTRKNLIIWDWDNTLFPTYAFRTYQHTKDKQFMSKLRILVTLIEDIFTEMIELYDASNIIIVTNAAPNWIYHCLNLDIVQHIFMKLQKLLKKHGIKTISASTEKIRSKYPKNYHKWKEVAFTEFFGKYFDENDENTINCVTSIGGSVVEYKASDRSSKYLTNRILNRILLKSDPSVTDMILQLQQIYSIMDQFRINAYDIDIDYSSSYSNTTC